MNNPSENQSLEKAQSRSLTETTYRGPTFSPAVDIFETDDRISVLADMPGVKPADLKIDLRDNLLTLIGRVDATTKQNESEILQEFVPGTYYRQFTLSEVIDQAKIDAKLTDGVLRLELPKAERAKPRQISVKAT